jgi:hypothetical protein
MIKFILLVVIALLLTAILPAWMVIVGLITAAFFIGNKNAKPNKSEKTSDYQ